VAAGPPRKLAGERHAGALVIEAIESGPPHADGARALLNDDPALIRVLTSLLSESHSGQFGSVATNSEDHLPWGELVKTLGSSWLADRVTAVAAKFEPTQFDPRAARAVAAAKRYVSGWVPEDIFERRPGEVAEENEDGEVEQSSDDADPE
jgi:hypothetical protein